MGKTFEALNRAEEQKRIRLNEISAGYSGLKQEKLAPLISDEVDAIYEEKLNQAKETADELSKMVSGLINSIKESMSES